MSFQYQKLSSHPNFAIYASSLVKMVLSAAVYGRSREVNIEEETTVKTLMSYLGNSPIPEVFGYYSNRKQARLQKIGQGGSWEGNMGFAERPKRLADSKRLHAA